MSLNQLMREHVSAVFLNTDHFAESIVVSSQDGTTWNLKAVIDIPDVGDSAEGALDTTGIISVATADLKRLRIKDGLLLVATIRNTTWHLYDQSTDEFGMTKFLIRRKDNSVNQKYTNLYDLSGDQTVWQERND